MWLCLASGICVICSNRIKNITTRPAPTCHYKRTRRSPAPSRPLVRRWPSRSWVGCTINTSEREFPTGTRHHSHPFLQWRRSPDRAIARAIRGANWRASRGCGDMKRRRLGQPPLKRRRGELPASPAVDRSHALLKPVAATFGAPLPFLAARITFEACSGFTHVTARRIAQPPTGDLCHEAPTHAVTRTSRSSATGSIDNSPGGFLLH